MSIKKVKRILPSFSLKMDGIPLLQPLPTQKVDQIDPLLLLHHHKHHVPKHSAPLGTGVSPHPHRGFMPITFILKGDIHHRDSLGNSQVITEGGVQWLVAGRGLHHSERPSKKTSENGGDQEFIQVWVNLPERMKMIPPQYLSAGKSDIPTSIENQNEIKVFSGNINGVIGPIKSPYPFTTALISLRKDFFLENIPQDEVLVLYVISGSVSVSGFGLVESENLIEFEPGGDSIQLSPRKESKILLMHGKPIGEKVKKYGPYVMNTQTEILEALRDAQMGKMGILIEEPENESTPYL